MALNALWWWIDRWRKSTAYTDMTLEQQGAYRNLLDEAALRGGPIPNDENVLAKACGDARRWKKLRPVVIQRFTLKADGWHNETMDGVLAESRRRADKQRDYRNRRGDGGGNVGGNKDGNKQAPPSPISYLLSPSPISDLRSPDPDHIRPSGVVPTVRDSIERSPAPAVPDARFLRFWEVYPKKTGKAAAVKAWVKIHPSEALTDLIVAAIARQKTWPQWTREYGRFIPNPATWLNQGRWDDEPVEADGSMFTSVSQKTAGNAEAGRRFVEHMAKGSAR